MDIDYNLISEDHISDDHNDEYSDVGGGADAVYNHGDVYNHVVSEVYDTDEQASDEQLTVIGTGGRIGVGRLMCPFRQGPSMADMNSYTKSRCTSNCALYNTEKMDCNINVIARYITRFIDISNTIRRG